MSSTNYFGCTKVDLVKVISRAEERVLKMKRIINIVSLLDYLIARIPLVLIL